MLLDGMLTQNSILDVAMQGNMVRKDVMLNNIANVDTPGYKRKVVAFEESLKNALRRAKPSKKADLSGVNVTMQKVNKDLKYRLDGNNVDIEAEMLELYETSVRYDVIASSVMNNYRRINSVFAAR